MGATELASGFLSLLGLGAWCRAGVPEELIPPEELFQRDLRTGIVINPLTLATETGMIYATAHLFLRPGVSFYAEVEGVAKLPPLPTVLPWGGEGRRVLVSTSQPVIWPDPPPAGRRTVLLTSPGLFDPGWRPSGLTPRAAAVPAPVVFSGWDMARGGPKPTRFAAPAGSVYYVDEAVAPRPVDGSLCDDADLARQGFGSYLEGAWPT
jgi:CRISPR-associated protein Cmr3